MEKHQSYINLSSPHLSERSNESVEDALVINGTSGFPSKLMPFEEVIRKYTGTSAVVALNSATSAIHLALIIVGIKKNDEVLCSTFTFCASVNPIIYQNATPVFVECEKDSWNMSPKHLEKAIQHRIIKGNKPKAIVVVHILGMPAAIERICEIAKRYDIPIIEDAAEALGSRYKGRSLGSFGVFGIFSFNTNKIITAFGGGALVSNNEGLIRKAKFLATQARDQAPHYQHSQVGYNYIMSNVTAGIGLNQMSILDKWVKKRRGNYNYYHQALSNVSGISFLAEPSAYYFSNRWLTTILVDSKLSDGVTQEDIRLALEKQNIEARPLWKPMHLQPVFEQYPYYGDRLSEKLFEQGLCLPSGSNLTTEDLDRVISIIRELISIN